MTKPYTQGSPAVAGLADGGFVIAWGRRGGDVSLQRYDADGRPSGAETLVGFADRSNNSGQPDMLALLDGGYFVVWSNRAGPAAGMQARFYDADGTARGDAFTLPNSGGYSPDAVLLANGNIAVTWQVSRSSHVDAQVIDGAGNVVKPTFRLDTSDADDGANSRVTALEDGRFVVTWSASNGTFASFFTGTGDKIGATRLIDTARYREIIALNDGNFMTIGGDSDARAQVFDASGNKVGARVPIGGVDYLTTVVEGGAADFTIVQLDRQAIVSRHYSSDLSIEAPAAQYLERSAGDTAPIAFAIGATSSAGALRYAVDPLSAPRNGELVFDQAAGTFVYVPRAGLLAVDDQFEVAITDASGATVYQTFTINTLREGTLTGTASADTLDEAGLYTGLVGGDGDDTYIVGRAGVTITEYHHGGAGGVDTLRAARSIDLPAHVEKLVLTGTDAVDGGGNEQANGLYGNEAANTLHGRGGNDVIVGNGGNDGLNGDDGNDRLYGGAGNDLLDGGQGADLMDGGDGDDTYLVDSEADAIVEWHHGGAGGIDKVIASVSYALAAQVEQIEATGTAATTLTGNVGANRLIGTTSAAANTLVGGDGNDSYSVGLGDVVIEQAGGGTDTVFTSQIHNGPDGYVLAPEVENLTSLAGGTATGNAGNNVMRAGAAATLFGGAGDDTLFGSGFDDVLSGDSGADVLRGGFDNDTYRAVDAADTIVEQANQGVDRVETALDYLLGANVEELVLLGTAARGTGNALANAIFGNASANILDGGAGKDRLFGGGGADTFVLSGPEGGLDQILDFDRGVDRIGFRAADFGLPAAALTPDTFQTGDSAVGPNATFVFDAEKDTLFWDADGAGGAAAVALMHFGNGATIGAGDFVLV